MVGVMVAIAVSGGLLLPLPKVHLVLIDTSQPKYDSVWFN